MMQWTVINGDKGVSSLKVTQWSQLLLALSTLSWNRHH